MNASREVFLNFGKPAPDQNVLSPETDEFARNLKERFKSICDEHGVNPWAVFNTRSSISLVTEENQLDTPITLPSSLSELVSRVFGDQAKTQKIRVGRSRSSFGEKFDASFDIDISDSYSSLPGYDSGVRATTLLPNGETIAVDPKIDFDLLAATYELRFSPANNSIIDGHKSRLMRFQMSEQMKQDFSGVFEILGNRDGTRLGVHRPIHGRSSINENG